MADERQRTIRHTSQKCEVCGGPVIFDFSQRILVCTSCGLVQSGRGKAELSFEDVLKALQFTDNVKELAERLNMTDWAVERTVLLMQKSGLVELKGEKVILTPKGRRSLYH